MRLLVISVGTWKVLTPEDERGGCRVLAALDDGRISTPSARRGMLSKLTVYLPAYGLPKHNKELCKTIEGSKGLYELRQQPTRGPKLRVLCFEDDGNVIVCATAFEKRNKLPKIEIKRAEDIRRAYFSSKESINLVEVVLEEPSDDAK